MSLALDPQLTSSSLVSNCLQPRLGVLLRHPFLQLIPSPNAFVTRLMVTTAGLVAGFFSHKCLNSGSHHTLLGVPVYTSHLFLSYTHIWPSLFAKPSPLHTEGKRTAG